MFLAREGDREAEAGRLQLRAPDVPAGEGGIGPAGGPTFRCSGQGRYEVPPCMGR